MPALAGPSTSRAQDSFSASASADPSSPRKRKRTQYRVENAHPAVRVSLVFSTRLSRLFYASLSSFLRRLVSHPFLYCQVTERDDDEEEDEEAPRRKKALLERSANVNAKSAKGGKGKGKSRESDASEKKSRGGGRKKKEGDKAVSSEERQRTLTQKNAARRVSRREHARENTQAAIEQRLESGRNRSPTVAAWWFETILDTAKHQQALHQALSDHEHDGDLELVIAVLEAFTQHEVSSHIGSAVGYRVSPHLMGHLVPSQSRLQRKCGLS
ncbi:hypothetical protein MSAN_01579000 [Mycena sanguinolenta]|uniref:Uncharacterized protein n=1 Tax=Mycena sanguinolenta TaxID=230812 RepID=A0A8H6XZZ6_9AGAR|nr:hypothetical protein MSAN_01579000 [Mycena sanguinolenta]